jgi:D-glycero-alpha-D-manno-heptose 1-phosphate guanylyltransferase
LEIIILAGGLGTRLKGYVDDVPKPMANVVDRPFLQILLESLKSNGFSRVILSLCYKPEKITNYFGKKYKGMEIIYCIESKPLGTGGAIKKCLKLANNDHVFIINGDTFLDINYKELFKSFSHNHYPLITVRKVSNISRYGEVKLEKNLVSSFNEKSENLSSGYINAGCYIFPKDLLNTVYDSKSFSLENDFLPSMVRKQRFQAYVSNNFFIDIGVPSDFIKAQSVLKDYYAK